MSKKELINALGRLLNNCDLLTVRAVYNVVRKMAGVNGAKEKNNN